MKKAMTILIFAAAALCRADGFDYSSLFNPQNLRQLNTTYRTPDGRPVFDISTESMSIDSRRKLWGVSVPLVAIKNLRLSVHAQNLADAEISKIYTPRPFDISASPLTLKIFGKKSVLTITASEATVEPDNILRLSDDAQMSVGEKRVALGKGATLRINGRVLYISSAGAGNLGVRL